MILFKMLFIMLWLSTIGCLAGATTNLRAISYVKDIVLHSDDAFETFRLPNNTKPEIYDISVKTWIDQGNVSFTGAVRIGIIVIESTNSITLHQRDLSIEDVRVFSAENNSISIGDVSYDSVFDFLFIPIAGSNLTAGNRYVVEIQFRGNMFFYSSGFYAQRYWNEDSDSWVYFASTQFEPTDARQAFPCYDEPAMKAFFTIRITHDPSFSAISNMPAIFETPVQNSDGSVTTEFQQTPLMSTYLIAMHISDFAHALSSTAAIPQRVFAIPHTINGTSHALTSGELLLDALTDYIGISYSLPKLDQVSVPSFGGAMENFGLVTYSDYYMIFDENVDDYYKTLSSVQTVAHELAHQWFGNLVSLTWWSFVWMKEGFATLFQFLAVDLIHPDWNMVDYMLVDTVHYALLYDSDYSYDRPMTYYVENPNDIDMLFDVISYSKGISRYDGKRPDGMTLTPWSRGKSLLWDITVQDTLAPSYIHLSSIKPGAVADHAERKKHNHHISLKEHHLFTSIAFESLNYCGPESGSVMRMFMLAFGEETFMRGITGYLNANMFSDASEDDLFEALDLAVWLEIDTIIPADTNVSIIMSSWTRQAGYPLITVERNYIERIDQVTLNQRRYYDPEPLSPPPVNSTWWIPYNFATPNNQTLTSSRASAWIPQNMHSLTITVDSLAADDYFLLDTHGAGFYRVIYDERNYRLISDAIIKNVSQFQLTFRANLLENVREFTFIDYLTFTTFLDVLRILENDDHYVAWHPVEDVLFEIDRLFSGHENYNIWRDFLRSLVERLYDTVGVDDIPDEPILRKHARRLAVQLACDMGSVHCRSDATRRLRQLITDSHEFHQNIRYVLYCAALRSANSNDFNFVWNRLLSSEDPDQRYQLKQIMGCVTSRLFLTVLLRSTLPSTNTNNVVYVGNEPYDVFVSVYENGMLGLELALDFMTENPLEAFQIYSSIVPYFLINVAYLVRRNDLIAKYQELLQFYLSQDLIPQMIVDLTDSMINENLLLREKYSPVINQWLMDNFV